MIIAIDESGTFDSEAKGRHFFVAVHLRQRKTLYRQKREQFATWESGLPRCLKNANGEIKSSKLSDQQLADFAHEVVCTPPKIGITSFAIRPADNPKGVVEKHRTVVLIGIGEGRKEYTALDRGRMAKAYEEFENWFRRLSYDHFLKIIVLGDCISSAMVNTVGHSISGKYDEELTRMRFIIDQDFIKGSRRNLFWHEVLRCQLYHESKSNPIPLLNKWKKKGHPFLEKYYRDGRLDFNELFWNQCEFASSHEHFELRISDAVNTIVSRYFNRACCLEAYRLVRTCFLKDRKVEQIVLKDFDLSSYHYNPGDNPWRKLSISHLESAGQERVKPT
ncbi:MAG TPA: DUF3800 domain-containing protein [bacterium]|nr:DUF3800 domain-containing protein [bacterium]